MSPEHYRFHGLIRIYAAECAQQEPKSERYLALVRLLGRERYFEPHRAPMLEKDPMLPGTAN